jgi:hypothetical protein
VYKGKLKRIRKRDLKRISSTFDFDGEYIISNAKVGLGTRKGSPILEETMGIVGRDGDSLSISVWVELYDDLRKMIGKRIKCVLIPEKYIASLYWIDEEAKK